MAANQNARKLLFTDLVNTKNSYRNITLDQSAREKSLSYYKMTDRKLILVKSLETNSAMQE